MISFPKNIILEDERVLLRRLERKDFDHLLPFVLNEPEIWSFYTHEMKDKNDLEKYIDFAMAEFDSERSYPFIVFDKAAKRYAGSSRFYDIQLNNLATQLGYTWYGKEFQRSGLNRHCKLLMLNYAFEDWGMER